jgi:hypothetical protein
MNGGGLTHEPSADGLDLLDVAAMDGGIDAGAMVGDLISLRLELASKEAELVALHQTLATERAQRLKAEDDLEQQEALAHADQPHEPAPSNPTTSPNK